MMAEIVNHRHAADDAADFHATLDAFERIERGLNLFVGKPAMFRRADDGERVAHVQFADEIQMKFETGNFKFSCRRPKPQIESLNGIIFAETEFFHRTMRDI